MEDYYYPNNFSRTTKSGIAEYRSALTLDWLAAEDNRQRELALAFETEAAPSVQASDSLKLHQLPQASLRKSSKAYAGTTELEKIAQKASARIARAFLLLRNLEGDEGTIIPELIQALVRSKLLVETSMLEAEPDLESLVRTSDLMMGEPHVTFPRLLAIVWMSATDPTTVNKNGWCPINKVSRYLMMTSPTNIARHMRSADSVVARARFILEEFIQHVTPNMYDKKNHALVQTTPHARAYSPGGRSNLHIHIRPKMRQFRKTSTTTRLIITPTMTTTPRNNKIEYMGDSQELVNRAKVELRNKSEVVQLSVCLLLCHLAVIAL